MSSEHLMNIEIQLQHHLFGKPDLTSEGSKSLIYTPSTVSLCSIAAVWEGNRRDPVHVCVSTPWQVADCDLINELA